ncbi:hypothetical protein GF367_01455 [Candidatus Woesearchaeota archaeon]|nr:hypothetical protein [Candidatus Woesearchaeota archaeon]
MARSTTCSATTRMRKKITPGPLPLLAVYPLPKLSSAILHQLTLFL